MATFYVGPRPVLKGRNTQDMVNVFKGTSGTYSYYPLFAKGLLDGAPDQHHTPGTGYHPGNVFLSQLFNGTTLYESTIPLSGTFADGVGYDGARFSPFTNRSVTSAKAFPSGFGHAADRENDYALYSNYIFDGVDSAKAFSAGYGHAERTTDYSLYNNYIFDGVTSAEVMPSGYGQANEETEYGRSKINEWKGVPSMRVL